MIEVWVNQGTIIEVPLYIHKIHIKVTMTCLYVTVYSFIVFCTQYYVVLCIMIVVTMYKQDVSSGVCVYYTDVFMVSL